MPNIQTIRQSSRNLFRELDVLKGIYQNSGFSYSQCHLLFELDQHKLLNLMELSQLLLIDKSTASRVIKKLLEQDYVKVDTTTADKRQKLYSLTAKGKKAVDNNNCLADDQVAAALSLLSPEEQQIVDQGLALYGKALQKSRRQADFHFRPIQKKDNVQVARIIRTVMTEFQAIGEGYSINDPEVDQMFEAYRGQKACFYVLEKEGKLLGCGGINQLRGAKDSVCELRKMYFYPEARGLGLGKKLLLLLLDEARKMGYTQCYLETIERMWQASLLYQKVGFKKLESPMGSTGHCSCDSLFLLEL
ncbi:MAG: MarR family winged helix-turn-helix transcriptional regulator [Bacteroidota bacterium]